MLRGIRRAHHTERLKYHFQRIQTSLTMRTQYRTEGNRGNVLAVNYELVSDATRALDALRRIEELTPDHLMSSDQRARSIALRRWFSDLIALPALPKWRVSGQASGPDQASQAEIDSLYEQFDDIADSASDPGPDLEMELRRRMPDSTEPFWSLQSVRALRGVVSMVIVDLGKVARGIWPGPIRGLGMLVTSRRPDYRGLCKKAVHDGAVLAVAGQRLRALADASRDAPPTFDQFYEFLETSHEAAQDLRDFAAWFGKFGWKNKESIISLLDDWKKFVSPEMLRGMEAYLEDVIKDLDDPVLLEESIQCLASILDDPEFDEKYESLLTSCLGDDAEL